MATLSAAKKVGSVALQVLDVFSDCLFAYQLAIERSCDMPWLPILATASIVASVIANGAAIVHMAFFFELPGLGRHFEKHAHGWVNVVALLALSGPKAVDLLTSGLFGAEGLSLYVKEGEKDALAALRHQLSDRVKMLGLG